jgi:hypothetical protein
MVLEGVWGALLMAFILSIISIWKSLGSHQRRAYGALRSFFKEISDIVDGDRRYKHFFQDQGLLNTTSDYFKARRTRDGWGRSYLTILFLLGCMPVAEAHQQGCAQPATISTAQILLAGLVIWTINVAGGHTAAKMDAVHKHIINNKPNIFILTDTKSDGKTIHTGWNWREYRIQEAVGRPSGWYNVRHGGVMIGIRNSLSMIEGHKDIPELENRLAHVTLKVSTTGKPTNLRVIGMYTPVTTRQGREAVNEKYEFYKKVKEWLLQPERRAKIGS